MPFKTCKTSYGHLFKLLLVFTSQVSETHWEESTFCHLLHAGAQRDAPDWTMICLTGER